MAAHLVRLAPEKRPYLRGLSSEFSTYSAFGRTQRLPDGPDGAERWLIGVVSGRTFAPASGGFDDIYGSDHHEIEVDKERGLVALTVKEPGAANRAETLRNGPFPERPSPGSKRAPSATVTKIGPWELRLGDGAQLPSLVETASPTAYAPRAEDIDDPTLIRRGYVAELRPDQKPEVRWLYSFEPSVEAAKLLVRAGSSEEKEVPAVWSGESAGWLRWAIEQEDGYAETVLSRDVERSEPFDDPLDDKDPQRLAREVAGRLWQLDESDRPFVRASLGQPKTQPCVASVQALEPDRDGRERWLITAYRAKDLPLWRRTGIGGAFEQGDIAAVGQHGEDVQFTVVRPGAREWTPHGAGTLQEPYLMPARPGERTPVFRLGAQSMTVGNDAVAAQLERIEDPLERGASDVEELDPKTRGDLSAFIAQRAPGEDPELRWLFSLDTSTSLSRGDRRIGDLLFAPDPRQPRVVHHVPLRGR